MLSEPTKETWCSYQGNARHAFWNETDARAEVLEVFTPAGLEKWFGELAEIVASDSIDLNDIVESGRRFGTELDIESIQPMMEVHGLRFVTRACTRRDE